MGGPPPNIVTSSEGSCIRCPQHRKITPSESAKTDTKRTRFGQLLNWWEFLELVGNAFGKTLGSIAHAEGY